MNLTIARVAAALLALFAVAGCTHASSGVANAPADEANAYVWTRGVGWTVPTSAAASTSPEN
jgi:hypothetical protein